RRLIVPTRSGWTAYFDNSILGTDPSPLAHFSAELSCRAVRMCFGADATIFELYGAEEHVGPDGVPTTWVRHVYAMNDGYWSFDAAGEPQPFERPERYSERRSATVSRLRCCGRISLHSESAPSTRASTCPIEMRCWSRSTSRSIPESVGGRSKRSRWDGRGIERTGGR